MFRPFGANKDETRPSNLGPFSSTALRRASSSASLATTCLERILLNLNLTCCKALPMNFPFRHQVTTAAGTDPSALHLSLALTAAEKGSARSTMATLRGNTEKGRKMRLFDVGYIAAPSRSGSRRGGSGDIHVWRAPSKGIPRKSSSVQSMRNVGRKSTRRRRSEIRRFSFLLFKWAKGSSLSESFFPPFPR